MHGCHRVEKQRINQLQTGLKQLRPNDQRHATADKKHHQREKQVQGTDIFVVGGV